MTIRELKNHEFRAEIQRIIFPGVIPGPEVFCLKEYEIDAEIQGNKFRKLKYNLIEANHQAKKLVLTFGGAYSNHIAATAAAAKLFNFQSIGVIRGDELKYKPLNTTLKSAQDKGMILKFISRSDYRLKSEKDYLQGLRSEFGDFYLIPEGGTNDLAVKGCQEILHPDCSNFTHIACALGTGGTFAGLLASARPWQQLIGFSALKGVNYSGVIQKYCNRKDYQLIEDQEFGGYARWNIELIRFLDSFYKMNGIRLEPIYTGKMAFGLKQLINSGYFKKTDRVLMVHTGGLQFWGSWKDKML